MNNKTAILEKKTDPANAKKQKVTVPVLISLLVQGLLSIVLAISFLELYFKLAGVGGQEFLQPDGQMGCQHIANKKVIWRMEGYSEDRLNSAGLRDSEHEVQKEEGTYRIALLGDSAVESLQVSMRETFGKVLEELLNAEIKKANTWLANKDKNIKHFEVINFGCSSYSTGQEILQYIKEADKYQPDAVVLLYNRGDSLENVINAKERKRAELRPYFYIDKDGLVKEDDSVLEANVDKLKYDPVKEFLRRNSNIYGVLTQLDLSLSLNEPRYCKLKNWWQALLNLPNRLVGRKEIISKSEYADQNAMVVTKALLSSLNKHVKEKHGKFISVIFPNILNYAELKEQAKELHILAKKEKFGYLDLSPSFLSCKDPSSNFLRYHFSPKGHALVAYGLFNVFVRDLEVGIGVFAGRK